MSPTSRRDGGEFVRVEVVSHEWVENHVEYVICVLNTNPEGRWVLKAQCRKRFRVLRAFHDELREDLFGSQRQRQLPRFPARRLFGSKSASFVRERSAGLQAYFNGLLYLKDDEIRLKVLDLFGVSAPPVVDLLGLLSRYGKSSIAGRYSCTKRLDSEIDVGSEIVGTGMHGGVVLGRRRATGTPCVIKSLRKRNLSKKALTYLRNEVEVYLSVDHPNIARLDSVFETSDKVHLVMEYLEGGELFDKITKRRLLTEPEAAHIVRQVLLSIAHLHAHGIMHGDIKPENFLFEEKDSRHLKLIDFGMSRRWDGQSAMTDMCGTLMYASPEVLAKSFTDKADLWSAGVLVYATLCGCHPWPGPSHAEVREQIRAGAPRFFAPRWDPLSADAKDFVKSLLRFDPRQRPTATEALAHRWLQCAGTDAEPRSSGVSTAVVRSLGNFANASPLRRACWSLVARSLPRKAVSELREAFYALDQRGDGTICLSDLEHELRSSENIGVVAVEDLFKCLDANGDGRFSYSEFLAAASHDIVEVSDDDIRLAFDRFDAAGHGFVTTDEVVEVLGDQIHGCSVSDMLKNALGDCDQRRTVAMTVQDFKCVVLRGSAETLKSSSSGCSLDSSVGSDSSSSSVSDSVLDGYGEPHKSPTPSALNLATRSFGALITDLAAGMAHAPTPLIVAGL